MPHRHRVFTECDVEVLQGRLAQLLKMSRQRALLLAMMVHYPVVTPDKIRRQFGEIDQRNLVARLRFTLRAMETAITVITVPGFGYCLNYSTRVRLAKLMSDNMTVPRPVEGKQVQV